MKALRFHGNRDLRVDDIPEPELKPGWVKIKNAWGGICGSDLHEYVTGPVYAPVEPHLLTGETIPAVMGHEFSGTVADLGDGITDLKIGQKVAVYPVLSDGTCYWCQRNLYGECRAWGFLGYSGYGGGFAEYVCVERKSIHLIPDDMSLEVAALVEPLAVAWHAVKLSGAKPGETCLIAGAGPIGIAVVHCLRAFGVETIVVSELSEARLDHAKQAGATHLLNPMKDDVVKTCYELGDGHGVHHAFDCAGVSVAVDTAIDSLRGQGSLINIALYEKPLVIKNPNTINRKSLKYMGSNIYTRDEFQEVIEAIESGKIRNPETMITGKVSLDEAVKEGFEALISNKDKHVKILVNAQA